ncbi:MAG: DUF2141 domain-containing protein [Pseudomonadota bacterium]
MKTLPFTTVLSLTAMLAPLPALAGAVDVTVTGLAAPGGEVGCALHQGAEGFPTGQTGVVQVWTTPDGGAARCRFENVAPGDYAVAVSHDLNGNRATDTNLLGMPTEAWGVSNNVRPTFRAPRFEEAAFAVADGPVALTIEVAK